MAEISVIVPVYKVEDFLDSCVQSIVDQTFGDLEIILVDDGSPDACPDMCDRWALKDSRIKVIHKNNGGLSSARNTGLEAMTGNFVFFIDSDDEMVPETLEILHDLIIEHDVDMVSADTSGSMIVISILKIYLCLAEIRSFLARKIFGISIMRTSFPKRNVI